MLSNNYLSLYQTDFYWEQRENYIKNKDMEGIIDFERRFALSNVVYIESKNCIGLTSQNPETTAVAGTDHSEIISVLLANNPNINTTLHAINSSEEELHPSSKMTYLQMAIRVCEEHMQTNNRTHR